MNAKLPIDIAAVVGSFLDALVRGDSTALRAALVDSGFSFEGPVDSFDDADAFVADVEKYALILKDIEMRRLFVDGAEACVVLCFVTSVANIGRTRAAMWVRTDGDGRIERIESFLDARAYTRMFDAGRAAGDV